MSIVTFRPGEVVVLKDKSFKVVACNFDGKLLLSPLLMKESNQDMMMRLQSTIPIPPGEAK